MTTADEGRCPQLPKDTNARISPIAKQAIGDLAHSTDLCPPSPHPPQGVTPPVPVTPLLGPVGAFQPWVSFGSSLVKGIVQMFSEKTWLPSCVYQMRICSAENCKQTENDANSSPYNLVPINLKLFENSNEILN